MYYLEQGPTEKAIIQTAYRDRQPLPDRIQNAPELLLGLEMYYSAYLDLSSCRQGGEGPISWLSISEYADKVEIHGEQREDLIYFTSHLDATHLEFKAKKLKESLSKSVPKKAARKR